MQCIQLFVKGKVSETIQSIEILQHFTFSFHSVVNVTSNTKLKLDFFPNVGCTFHIIGICFQQQPNLIPQLI